MQGLCHIGSKAVPAPPCPTQGHGNRGPKWERKFLQEVPLGTAEVVPSDGNPKFHLLSCCCLVPATVSRDKSHTAEAGWLQAAPNRDKMLSEGCPEVIFDKTPKGRPCIGSVLQTQPLSNPTVGVRSFPALFHSKFFLLLFPLLCLLHPIYRTPFTGVSRLLTFILGILFTSWTCHRAITHPGSSPA